jgi:uncharacterized protein DUF1329
MRITRVGWLFCLGSGILWGACGAGQNTLLPSSMQSATRQSSSSSTPSAGDRPEENFADQTLRSFFPYRDRPPHVSGIAAGTALARGNWQLAQEVLPPELLNAVRDGELTILVQDTSDLPVSPEYITATMDHAGDVSLDETGNLAHYRAGLPFPLLDPADPHAGLKAAWNARYADNGDAVQRLETLQVRNNEGGYVYGFSYFYARAYGMHHANPAHDIPGWGEEGVWYKEFMQVLHPVPSITIHPQLGLVHLRYWYDADTHPVLQWYITGYLSINKNVTLVYNPESSAWRFPLLYEDLVGGYLHAYQWRLLGTQVALVPGFVQGTTPLYGGQHAGYPLDPWELRTVYVVEATPRRPEHPYGRKVFFFDQQTFAPLYVLIYDHEGKFWRMNFYSYAHPNVYPGGTDVRVPILIGRSWVDLTIDGATIDLVSDAVYNKPLPPEYFTRANMLAKGK